MAMIVATLFQTYGETRLAVENPLILNIALLAGFSLLILSTLRKTSNTHALSLIQTSQIKGLGILLVILYHLSIHTIENAEDLPLFTDVGFIGVALFLIISGYGIAFSLKNKGTENFFLRRLGRLYVPIFFAMMLRIILAFFLDSGLDKGFLFNTLNIFINVNELDRNLWFIPFILFWYLASYLIWRTDFSVPFKLLLLACVSLTFYISPPNIYLWQTNAFSFPLGFFMGIYSKEVSDWLSRLINGSFLRLITTCSLFILIAQLLYHNVQLDMRDLLFLLIAILIAGFFSTRSLRYFRLPLPGQIRSRFSSEHLAFFLAIVIFVLNYTIRFGDLAIGSAITLILTNFSGIFFSFSIMFLPLFFLRFSLYSQFLNFVGDISFELFLLHGMFMYKFDFILFRGDLAITFFLYFAATCFACVLLRQVSTLALSSIGTK